MLSIKLSYVKIEKCHCVTSPVLSLLLLSGNPHGVGTHIDIGGNAQEHSGIYFQKKLCATSVGKWNTK